MNATRRLANIKAGRPPHFETTTWAAALVRRPKPVVLIWLYSWGDGDLDVLYLEPRSSAT
jgi:hypothetical protein